MNRGEGVNEDPTGSFMVAITEYLGSPAEMPTTFQHPTRKSEFLPTLQEIIDTEKPEGAPKEAAWIWGPDDEIGRLNLLTPDHVSSVLSSQARSSGIVCPLNWDVTLPRHPAFARQACRTVVKPFEDVLVNDETLEMNTQSGSQFDGFRHIAFQETGTFYNGVRQDEIAGKRLPEGLGGGDADADAHAHAHAHGEERGRPSKASTRIGIQAAAQHGIVSRGVLLDYARWMKEVKKVEYDPFSRHAIELADILQVAEWEGVQFEKGDVLLVRTGWIEKYMMCLDVVEGENKKKKKDPHASARESTSTVEAASVSSFSRLTKGEAQNELDRASKEHPTAIGLSQSQEMKTFLHDKYFSVVGGDQPAFEVWPGNTFPLLHEYLLACWGVLIGEMLDLEKLGRACKGKGKWDFLFVSALMNIPGGVASLGNAICVL
ncbi:hypothetical protein MKZ38_008854 [Zalerion maritima]|uniref:Cyclase n=1 Tax=Zalerion maritima TaxID=339359 RepID=A0AAD5RGP2_9PEZI|nr:hypothetical protein MKZ38_008854 [Zalerion maritima]